MVIAMEVLRIVFFEGNENKGVLQKDVLSQ